MTILSQSLAWTMASRSGAMATAIGMAAAVPGSQMSLQKALCGLASLILSGGSSLPSQQQRHASHLAYEVVTAGSPSPQHPHPAASPSRTLVLLHGLLGSGRNWRTFARRLVEAAAATHPAAGGPWQALLVDLRCHGGSARRPGLNPPHTMRSAAEDVSRLIRQQLGNHAPGAILGHSLGGKVALALLEQSAAAAAAADAASHGRGTIAASHGHSHEAWCTPPRQLWVLDSQPGLVNADDDAGTGVSTVLKTVHSIPLPIPNRAWLLDQLRARGLSEGLAAWLGSSLVPATDVASHQPHHQHTQLYQHSLMDPLQMMLQRQAMTAAAAGGEEGGVGGEFGAVGAGVVGGGPQGLTWSFDVQGAGAMYMSYRTTNFWHLLECPPHGTTVHLVQGERSDRWSPEAERRFKEALAIHEVNTSASEALAVAGHAEVAVDGQGSSGGLRRHVLPDAGHLLHVDNPEGLLGLLVPKLAGM